MNKAKELILKDLHQNLKDKMANAVTDFQDLCDAADIPARESRCELVTIMVQLAAAGMIAWTNMSPEHAGSILTRAITDLRKQVRER